MTTPQTAEKSTTGDPEPWRNSDRLMLIDYRLREVTEDDEAGAIDRYVKARLKAGDNFHTIARNLFMMTGGMFSVSHATLARAWDPLHSAV